MVFDKAVNFADCILDDENKDRTVFVEPLRPGGRIEITLSQFNRVADGVAHGLLEAGLAPQERIALASANRWEFMAAFYGILRAGMVAVPLNYKLPDDVLSALVNQVDVRLAFCDDERSQSVSSIECINFDADGGAKFKAFTEQKIRPLPRVDLTSVAKILFTSGSTGMPKGVPSTHQGLIWALRKYAPADGTPRTGRTLIVAPTYHKNGLFLSCEAIASGKTIVSMPAFHARPYLETIAAEECTALSGVPSMFAMAAKESDLIDRLNLTSVSSALIGSAPLSERLIQRIREIFPNMEIKNGYGLTEAGPAIFGPHPNGLERPIASVGCPWPDIEWRFASKECADEGVLQLKTPAMTSGYWGRPELTAERFNQGWYHTGDVMRRDEDGFFYFVGREDDMFVCGGENIYPGQVERTLELHPDVAEAVVVSAPDDIKGAVPVAFVVLRDGAAFDEHGLKQFSLSRGPAYQHPRRIAALEALPLASTNKVDRKALALNAVELVADRERF